MAPETRRWLIVTLVLSAGFFAGEALLAARPFLVHLWADLLWTLAALAAALRGLRASGRMPERHLRLAWRAFAAGSFAWFLGMLAWNWEELVAGRYAPFPSLGMPGFLALPVLLGIGFGLVQAGSRPTGSVQLQLADAGFFTFLMLLVNVALLAGPLQLYRGSPLTLASILAYPVLHSSALVLGLVVLARLRGRERRWLLLAVLGLAVLTGTVTVYAYSLLNRAYQVGMVLDVFWFLALLLLFVAAVEAESLAGETGPAPGPEPTRSLALESMLPAAALVVVVLGILSYSDQLDSVLTWLLLPAAVGVSIFYGLRLWLSRLAEAELGAERDRLFRQALEARELAEHRERREAFLAEASRHLGASLDYEQTLAGVAALATPFLADGCGFAVARPDGPGFAVAAHLRSDEQPRLVAALRAALEAPGDAAGLARALGSGRTELLTPAGGPGGDPAARLFSHGLLAVPLRVRGEVVGLLALGRERAGAGFGAEEIALAEELARRCSLAVENARLFQRARAAVALRDEFLAVASHEIRTPLTPLLLQLERLQRALRRGEPERADPLLGSAIDQVHRLAELAGKLVDASLVADSPLELRREPVDLAEIAAGVVGECGVSAERAGSPLTLRVDSPARGNWDPGRLAQVLRNLVANAVKFGAGRPIEVRVWSLPDRALVSVTDHGIGLEPGSVERIFERWGRASSVRHFGGLGLGLYLSRHLVEAHGGRIAVESTPGAGTTFRVELPLLPEGTTAAGG